MTGTGLAESAPLGVKLLEREYALSAVGYQPWIDKSPEVLAEQAVIQQFLTAKGNTHFGRGAFVARDAKILTRKFEIGVDSWVAAGAIIRGEVKIGNESTINPYAQSPEK